MKKHILYLMLLVVGSATTALAQDDESIAHSKSFKEMTGRKATPGSKNWRLPPLLPAAFGVRNQNFSN